ncbi:GntR family transcriptional regulator [Kribbella turkmenica]|uniref:GntR family transcriptional regulator n=1 Tax=Kribbella turkmenica TaxID=2530375 RepID=UPI0014054B4B
MFGHRAGTVVPGERLPSIRTVARGLNLSPTTVSAAWRLLARANLIHPDGARGTVVAEGAGQGPVRHRRALLYEAKFEVDLLDRPPGRGVAAGPGAFAATGPAERPAGELPGRADRAGTARTPAGGLAEPGRDADDGRRRHRRAGPDRADPPAVR